jgi:inner membrane protein
MDIVTHAITGALVAATFSPPNLRRRAALAGAVGGCLPDLDVLIRSPSDSLLVLEYHRHFSHSLIFAPFGAVLATLLLWPFFRKHLAAGVLYTALFASYASACLLDVFTSYGTHLFWPFLPYPIALNMIAVVDPMFTLLITAGLVFALAKPAALAQPSELPGWAGQPAHKWRKWVGLLAGAAYLCAGALQSHRAEDATRRWAERQVPDAVAILVKPTLGNLLLWRALISSSDGKVQAAAVRPGLFDTKIYPGGRAHLLQPEDLNLPMGSRALRDMERFYEFSEGYLVQFPGGSDEVGDVRYAMLPTSVTPLWGIRVSRKEPNGDTVFFTRRDSAHETRQTFLQMLAGRPLHDTLPP